MLPSFDLTSLVPWVIAHGYFLFFLVAVIEGTLITTAAGVAAGLGHFNIFFIILIAIAGDLTADVIYYFIGYQSRSTIIESHGHRFGLTRSRMEKIEHLVQHHFKKTMVVIKLSPFLPVPGLIAIGASRVSLRRFVEMSLIITAPKAIFFALLGFYSGKTYMYLTQTVTNGSYIAGGLVLLIALIYIAYRKITANISKEAHLE